VILEGFFSRLGFAVIYFVLPFYAMKLGMSFAEVGLVAALRGVAIILVKPVMGIAADRYGRKTVYIGSLAGRFIVSALFIVAVTPWTIYAIRFLHGVSMAARGPSAATIIAEHSPPDRVARAYSWYYTARELGASLGYLVGGSFLALGDKGYFIAFIFASVSSAISLCLAMYFVHEKEVNDSSRESAAQKAASFSNLRSLWKYGGLGVLIATAGSMLTPLFPLLATQHGGLNEVQVGMIISLSSLVTIFSGPLFGWLADKFSRTAILAVRSLANITSSLLFLGSPGFASFLVGRTADDVGKAAFRPAWNSLLSELSQRFNPKQRARVIAYLDTASSLGDVLGPALAGWLWDWKGVVWLLVARLVITAAGEIYTIVLLQHSTSKSMTTLTAIVHGFVRWFTPASKL